MDHPSNDVVFSEVKQEIDFAVQTRNEEGHLGYFLTLKGAMEATKLDPSIWKISFMLPTGERVRLTRNAMAITGWEYDPISFPESLS